MTRVTSHKRDENLYSNASEGLSTTSHTHGRVCGRCCVTIVNKSSGSDTSRPPAAAVSMNPTLDETVSSLLWLHLRIQLYHRLALIRPEWFSGKEPYPRLSTPALPEHRRSGGILKPYPNLCLFLFNYRLWTPKGSKSRNDSSALRDVNNH